MTLIEAAKDVVARWDSPDWKDGTHTAEYIARLRAAIEEAEKQEPLFLLHTGAIYGNERDEYETEADSHERVERFCDQHPGRTIPLYAAPQPARKPMTEALIVAASEYLREQTDRQEKVGSFVNGSVPAMHWIDHAGQQQAMPMHELQADLRGTVRPPCPAVGAGGALACTDGADRSDGASDGA